MKIVSKFDKDKDGRLNNDERKAAREYVTKQRAGRQGRGFGPRPFGGRDNAEPAQPGRKLTPAEVKSYPGQPIYALNVLRTFFLEFENADWEKELADFKGTDVEVPAKLTVDGKTYPDVGVHFRGTSSFMMIPEGRKRSLNLTLDFAHKDQNLGGYRTFNLLNSNDDPSFLHTVLFCQIARQYIPAPQANWVRLVINGECWGVYPNVEQFNKDFVKEWFKTNKGARWKVQGSPNGRGGLNYLGEDLAAYQKIYSIKSKDDPKDWASLIRLTKVLNETPADQLEAALAPLLDIDGVLKFMALDNALVNNDGFWTRASDYYLYLDVDGRFHVIPNDVNESFSSGGGPGGPGGFGPGGPGGRGGPNGFGPGMIVAAQMLEQGDADKNGKLSRDELSNLADAWFGKVDPDNTGKLTQEQFITKANALFPMPPGFGPPGGDMPGRGQGGFGPASFLGPGLFTACDGNKDGSLTRAELKETFAKWFAQWDAKQSGTISEEQLRTGLNAALPAPNFGGRGGPGGGGRGRGGPGPGGTVELDPLVTASDESKPLLSKLLAVPALKSRYLAYVREIAEKWLDWKKLGPLAQQGHDLIAEDVKADTRKIYSTEAFNTSLVQDGQATAGLKGFADKRRAFLLNYPAIKQAKY